MHICLWFKEHMSMTTSRDLGLGCEEKLHSQSLFLPFAPTLPSLSAAQSGTWKTAFAASVSTFCSNSSSSTCQQNGKLHSQSLNFCLFFQLFLPYLLHKVAPEKNCTRSHCIYLMLQLFLLSLKKLHSQSLFLPLASTLPLQPPPLCGCGQFINSLLR